MLGVGHEQFCIEHETIYEIEPGVQESSNMNETLDLSILNKKTFYIYI